MNIMADITYTQYNVKLLGTAVETIGSFGYWIKANTSYMLPAINLLIGGLSSSVSVEATLGLMELFSHCHMHMTPYVEPLLKAILVAGYMNESDLENLVSTMGSVMSLMPGEELYNQLEAIVGPWFEELRAICREQEKTSLARNHIIFRLKMLSPLFISLKTKEDEESDNNFNSNSVLVVIDSTIQLSQKILEIWCGHMDVVEAVCSTMSNAIISLRINDLPRVTSNICSLVAFSFKMRCCPPTLELSKAVILKFYKNDVTRPVMKELLREFIHQGFVVFEITPEESYSDIADITGSFFKYFAQIIKMAPNILMDKELPYNKLLAFALRGMSMQEGVAIRSSLDFLEELVLHSQSYEHIKEIVLDTIEQIVFTSLMCIGSVSPASEVENFVGLFLALNREYSRHMTCAVFTFFAKPDFPYPHLTKMERIIQGILIVEEGDDRELLQKYICDMALKMRRLAEQLH
ncbi:uncharacterized protein LOC110175941 [Drosophila serrata]|uniref:uncharacterized protein LOC110175941 n=1 Tax=Drosophila serrata TaxID=7274 RepID=UPI000A1D0D49|nr:uncharacterized protein LOC110175941 [Drosophila serrata]